MKRNAEVGLFTKPSLLIAQNKSGFKEYFMATQDQSLIMVLGIPGSGASVLVECFKIVGMGNDSIEPSDNTAKISGRNVENEIFQVHDALMQSFDFQWDMIGNLPDNWVFSPAAEAAKSRLCEIISQSFSNPIDVIAYDPRMSRLMPLWMDVFRELNIDPAIIHMVRHPSEVADSLKSLNGMDLQKGHLLWMVYHRDAMTACKDQRHMFITYDQLLADPVVTLNAVNRKLGINYPLGLENRYSQILQFVRPEKKHHHYCQPDHPTGFIHFARFYDHLRQYNSGDIQLVPGQNQSDRLFKNLEMDDAAALLLMLSNPDVSLSDSDKVHMIGFFNHLLGLLSHYEITQRPYDKESRHILSSGDQNAEVLYLKVLFTGENKEEIAYDSGSNHKELLFPDEWQHLLVKLDRPHTLKSQGLCLVPLNCTGLIYISAISLKHAVTDAPLWECKRDNGFDVCSVEGTSICMDNSDELRILATGNAPRIILPAVPDLPDVPVILEVWIRVTRNLSDLVSVWTRHEAECQTQKKQIETLNARYENVESGRREIQKQFEEAKLRNEQFLAEQNSMAEQLHVQSNENKTLRIELEQQNRDWEIKIQKTENDLDRQIKLCREYFFMLSGAEKRLSAARDHEEVFGSMMQKLESDFHDLLGSFRWRLGNRVVRLTESLLLRQKQPLAVDHMQRVFNQFKSRKKDKRKSSPHLRVYCHDGHTISKLNRWVRQLNTDFLALKNSKRWKLGNALIKGVDLLTFKSGQATAMDHLESIFKDYEKRLSGKEIEDMKIIYKQIRYLEKDFQAVAGSMRWKMGDGIFSVIDTLLFRGKKPTAFDHINSIFRGYHKWRTERNE